MTLDKFAKGGLTQAGSIHYRSKCKECYAEEQRGRRGDDSERYREYWKSHHKKHRDKRILAMREARRKMRQRGLDALGGKCAHCGRTNPKVLSFGHVKNDGNEHRKRMKYPDYVYRDWDKRGWPKDEVELQCYNYNLGGDCD